MRDVQTIVSILFQLRLFNGLLEMEACRRRRLTLVGHSIREFCELDTPILMFDKDGAFAVATLKEVGGVF